MHAVFCSVATALLITKRFYQLFCYCALCNSCTYESCGLYFTHLY